MRRADGAVQWEMDTLKRRGLTAPTIDGDSLVVGDFEGYLHWLDKETGAITARQKTDGERITNAAVADSERVFVQTDSGKLLVFRSAAREVKTADSGQ
jgi:outer membrane protein assembly factor BamB